MKINKFSTFMTCFSGMYWDLSWEGSCSEGGIIQSAINRSSDCIGQDRDSCHLCTLSTIPQHFIHTMKPNGPLLLTDITLSCRMHPAGKVDISWYLAIPRFPQSDQPIRKPSADAIHWVVKHSRHPDLKSSSNVSLLFAWITGHAKDPSSLVLLFLIFTTAIILISN